MIKITDEMVEKACKINMHPLAEPSATEMRHMRASLESVAPLIAKAEAEECAEIAKHELEACVALGRDKRAASMILSTIRARHAKTASEPKSTE